jgi:chromosome segregation ATPase
VEETKKKDLKNERLIRALQHLGTAHSTLKKQARAIPKLSKNLDQLTERNTALREDKTELEQLLDTLRHEMEAMLEEVEQLKQDRDMYARKADTLERDMYTISRASSYESMGAMQSQLDVYQRQVQELEQTHQENANCIDKLRLENRQLSDNMYAIKRDMARMTSKHESEMAVLSFEKIGLHKKVNQLLCQKTPENNNKEEVKVVQQENTDLEVALRRAVAERDGQLSKLSLLLERKEREIQHVSQNKEKRIDCEIQAREKEFQHQMTLRFQKENDALQLHLTRETRALSYQIADLELELAGAQRQLDSHHGEMQRKDKEIKQSRDKVSELSESIICLEDRAVIMEQETLHLYSRNLQLTHHLGELDL